MIAKAALWVVLAAGPVFADGPIFANRANGLPTPALVYDGDWTHFVGGGVAVFDCNGDAFPEIFAAGGSNPAQLLLNQTGVPGGDLRFAPAPIEAMTGVTGAYPLDIDSDGLLDLVVLRAGPNVILKGDGACGFTDATAMFAIDARDQWSTAFSATWEGGSFLPTLAIGNYVDRTDPEGPFMACDVNLLYRPDADRYLPPLELAPGYCALSMLFSDWSRQGRADLRVSNDRHYYVRDGSEQMWRMDPLRLLGPEDAWVPVSIWGMGIASADLNGDLRPDVMLTSMGDQLLQFATDGDGFRAAPHSIGSYATRPHIGDDGRPSTGWHAQFGDVDNNGRTDLFIAKGNVDQMPGNAMHDPNNLLMQQDDGTFREASVAAGIATTDRSRGAALSDLNRDGLLDLVVVNRRAPMELWQNVTDTAGNWLALTPRQTGANTFAIGGWVEVLDSDGTVRTTELTIGGGHAGGQAGPVHFGLGDSTEARVRVLWPDRSASDWITVPANRETTIWRD